MIIRINIKFKRKVVCTDWHKQPKIPKYNEFNRHPNATASDCAPACAPSSQSLTRTEAQSGCTKSGPFHGLRRYPVREAGPQHYEEKVGTEHTSSLPKE